MILVVTGEKCDDRLQPRVARRYMDDILLLMRKGGWDSQRFYEDFRRSECYAERAEAGAGLWRSQVLRDSLTETLKTN